MIFDLVGTDKSLLVQIQLLGGFSVCVAGTRIPDEHWRSRRARNLIKLLALSHSHAMHRDQIIDALWPETDTDSAANNFYQTLFNARGAFGSCGTNCLVLKDRILHLGGFDGSNVISDVEQFESAASVCLAGENILDQWTAALAQYSGDLLPDDLYEDWTIARREGLRQTYFSLLLGLGGLYEKRAAYPAGIEILQRALALDACSEEAHMGLMRLYAQNGQRLSALRQYAQLRDTLKKELDMEPGETVQQLFRTIHSGRMVPDLPLSGDSNHLPIHLTTFIGRKKEIGLLRQIIADRQTRLVTVTGGGGTGKTRLGLQVAGDLAELFPGGVWMVDLAIQTDAARVGGAVATVLGLHEVEGRTIIEVLVEFLRDKRVLIMLDNCEHIVRAAAELAEVLLQRCAKLTVLATSRELLGVDGEMLFHCPSMALPDELDRPGGNWAAAGECESVALFMERAVLADQDFCLTEKTAFQVVKICRFLDGIPLAIEMAAARLRSLSIDQVAARLGSVFHLLDGSARTTPKRHQTLNALIDWSYTLLSPKERLLLDRVSVFVGGWTLEAAEAVCADLGPGAGCPSSAGVITQEEIVELSGWLVDKSLILFEHLPEKEPRYRILEPIRQFMAERLAERGETGRLRSRHLVYFWHFAEMAQPHLRGWGMVEWLQHLETELSNLRAGLDEALKSGLVEEGLRLAAALHWFWHIHNRRREGADWLERLLAAEDPQTDSAYGTINRRKVRANALIVNGFLEIQTFAYSANAKGKQLLSQGREIATQLSGDGQFLATLADYFRAETEADVRSCSEAFLKSGDAFYAKECVTDQINFSIERDDLSQAKIYALACLNVSRDLGDIDGEGWALSRLGLIELQVGCYESAVDSWRAAQACFRAVGNLEYCAGDRICELGVDLIRGDYEKARQPLIEMERLGREKSSPFVVFKSLINLIQLSWCLKDFQGGEHWCGELSKIPFWAEKTDLSYFRGRMAYTQGNLEQAGAHLRNLNPHLAWKRCFGIQALGILAVRRKQERCGVVLFGAMDDEMRKIAPLVLPLERQEYQQACELALQALGEQDYQEAWAEGRMMTYEDAFAFAMQSLDEGAPMKEAKLGGLTRSGIL